MKREVPFLLSVVGSHSFFIIKMADGSINIIFIVALFATWGLFQIFFIIYIYDTNKILRQNLSFLSEHTYHMQKSLFRSLIAEILCLNIILLIMVLTLLLGVFLKLPYTGPIFTVLFDIMVVCHPLFVMIIQCFYIRVFREFILKLFRRRNLIQVLTARPTVASTFE